jgi:hypothetical protein
MWETCHLLPRCEIYSEYPHMVRDSTGRILPNHETNGYMYCYMDGVQTAMHQLIAQQWIDNPNFYTEVDHLNGDRSDNHVSNLRWVTRKMNMNNKHNYGERDVVYVNELPEGAISVPTYGDWTFENLFFSPSTNRFYLYTELNHYRELPYIRVGNHYLSCATDTDNKQHNIYYTKFKKLYGL